MFENYRNEIFYVDISKTQSSEKNTLDFLSYLLSIDVCLDILFTRKFLYNALFNYHRYLEIIRNYGLHCLQLRNTSMECYYCKKDFLDCECEREVTSIQFHQPYNDVCFLCGHRSFSPLLDFEPMLCPCFYSSGAEDGSEEKEEDVEQEERNEIDNDYMSEELNVIATNVEIEDKSVPTDGTDEKMPKTIVLSLFGPKKIDKKKILKSPNKTLIIKYKSCRLTVPWKTIYERLMFQRKRSRIKPSDIY